MAPPTGFPWLSATFTTTGGLIGAPATVVDGCVSKVIWLTAPAMFVKVQVAVFPPTVAVTVNVPAVVLAVRVGATASPCGSVVTDAVDEPPKVPPAPPDGTTVNVIVVFGAGFAKESVTCATSGNGNGVQLPCSQAFHPRPECSRPSRP